MEAPNTTTESFFARNVGVKPIMLHSVVAACMADSGKFAKGETPSTPVIGRKTRERNANDF